MDKFFIFSISLILLVGFLLVDQIFKPGYLVCQDNPPHLAEANFLVNQLIPKGKLFGWAYLDSAGYPIFMYDYPLGFWFIAVLYFTLMLDLILSYKIIIFLSYIGVSLALYVLLSYRFDKKISLVITTLSLFQYDFISFSLNGLWGQYFSLIFFLFYLHFLDKSLRVKLALKNFISVGLFAALVVLSHPTSAFFMGIMTLTVLIIYRIKRTIHLKAVLPYLVLSLVICGFLSAFYIYPILYTTSWIRPSGGIQPSSVLSMIIKSAGYLFLPHLRSPEIKNDLGWSNEAFDLKKFNGNIVNSINLIFINVSEIILTTIFLISLLSFVKSKKKDPFILVMLIDFLFAVILGSEVLSFTPLNKQAFLSNILQFPRYFVFARIFMLVITASEFSSIIKVVKNKLPKTWGNLSFYFIISVLLAVLLASYYPIVNSGYLCTKTSQDIPQINDLANVWNWVKNNVDGTKMRVLYQDTYETSKSNFIRDSHIFALSTTFTDVQSIGTWQAGAIYVPYTIVTNYGLLFNKSVEVISDSEISYWMKIYNTKFVVSSENTLEMKLETSRLFEKVASFGDFTIFELKDYIPTWLRKNGVDQNVVMVNLKEEKIKSVIEAEKDDMITIKVSYHPFWKGFVNGKETTLKADPLNMIEFKSEFDGELEILLKYERPFLI